jgi:hypothetical protein
MPRLPPQFTELIASLELPLDDDFVEPLAEFSAAELVLIARQAVNLLGRGWGAAMVELGAPRAAIPAPITAERLAATPGFSDLLAGTRELSPGERDGALIGQIQGGLQALAGRSAGAPAALTLPDQPGQRPRASAPRLLPGWQSAITSSGRRRRRCCRRP